MIDSLSVSGRSENMRRIRARNTKPEIAVRKLLRLMGFRYRLHAKDLPGNPDIVFRGKMKAIFVHGCFWHQHGGCREGRIPNSRQEYWVPKLKRNQARDAVNTAALSEAGWHHLIIWECEVKDLALLRERLRIFLEAPLD